MYPGLGDIPDTGRMYIKGYLYQRIFISKDIYILSYIQKGYFLSFFGAKYFEDILSELFGRPSPSPSPRTSADSDFETTSDSDSDSACLFVYAFIL
jgi:hypothetical protein